MKTAEAHNAQFVGKYEKLSDGSISAPGIDIYPMKAVDTDTGEEFKLETEQDYNDFAFDVFASMHPHEAAAHDWKRFVALCQKKNPKLTPKAIKKLLWET